MPKEKGNRCAVTCAILVATGSRRSTCSSAAQPEPSPRDLLASNRTARTREPWGSTSARDTWLEELLNAVGDRIQEEMCTYAMASMPLASLSSSETSLSGELPVYIYI